MTEFTMEEFLADPKQAFAAIDAINPDEGVQSVGIDNGRYYLVSAGLYQMLADLSQFNSEGGLAGLLDEVDELFDNLGRLKGLTEMIDTPPASSTGGLKS